MRLFLAAWLVMSSGQALAGDVRGLSGRDTSMAGRRVLAAGYQHSLAVDPSGDVWFWGMDTFGQKNLTPVRIQELDSVVAVTANNAHFLALRADGTVWAWGGHLMGALGLGMISEQHTPVQVPGLSDVVDISTGSYHTLAVRRDGTVWAWGSNNEGQLGEEPGPIHYTPTQVPGLTGCGGRLGWH